MSIGEVTCKNERTEFGEVFRAEGTLGEGAFLKEKFRGQACWSWVVGGAAKLPWASCDLIPSTVEKMWRESVYVGMVWGLLFMTTATCSPPISSPGSLCSKTKREKKEKSGRKVGQREGCRAI